MVLSMQTIKAIVKPHHSYNYAYCQEPELISGGLELGADDYMTSLLALGAYRR